MIFKSAEDPDN